jgi:N-acetylmuramoyl-L-alanine amidase
MGNVREMWTLERLSGKWLARGLAVALAAVAGAFLLGGCAGGFGIFGSYGYYGPGAGFFDTVIVDAGHGGHDPGARTVSGSREKVVTLDTSRRLAAILRRNGFRVIETRSTDHYVSLSRRAAISNAHPRAIFVSIHYNWARRRGARGIEVFYHEIRGRRLAANILRESLRAYPTHNRGIKTARFYVLRNNRRPAVLVELGFLSNSADNRRIQNPATRQRLAEAVAAGIIAERQGRIP